MLRSKTRFVTSLPKHNKNFSSFFADIPQNSNLKEILGKKRHSVLVPNKFFEEFN
jgi:hypothetical protein